MVPEGTFNPKLVALLFSLLYVGSGTFVDSSSGMFRYTRLNCAPVYGEALTLEEECVLAGGGGGGIKCRVLADKVDSGEIDGAESGS